MKPRHPWFKFYPSDWRGSSKLKSCSAVARAVLVEMMCIMHDANRYGFLEIAGHRVTDADLAAQSGLPLKQIAAGWRELKTKGVIEQDTKGATFSPRMVRDEEIRQKRASGGGKSAEHPNVQQPKDTLEGYPSRALEDIHKGSPQIPDARIPDKERVREHPKRSPSSGMVGDIVGQIMPAVNE